MIKLDTSILKSIQHLYKYIPSTRKIQFAALLFLTIIVSFAEVLSIGSVIPFIGALTNPEYIYNHQMAQPFLAVLGLDSPDQILLPLTVFFGISVVVATILRVLLTLVSVKVSFGVGIDLSVDIYKKTLYQPYLAHVGRNSSESINTITVKVSEVIFYIIMPALNFVSATIVSIFILTAIVYFTPQSALFVLSLLALVYILIVKATRNTLLKNSQNIAKKSTQVIKILQEGLGGIRDILIDGTQKEFCSNYEKTVKILRQAQGDNQIFNIAPRFIIEGLGMLFVAALAYILSQQEEGMMSAMPLLASIAFAMQRLLPTMQLLYSSWSQIHGAQASLSDTLIFLDQKLPRHNNDSALSVANFKECIAIENVSFYYKGEKRKTLDSVNLTIHKGEKIGFIGETGSGKSTLLDVVMGLIHPSSGQIAIDGDVLDESNYQSWQSILAHVPQAIFLSDGTIEENIAFGVSADKVDRGRVEKAARMAKISDVIESLPDGYQAIVGERGVQLSGGQRQRIGIARAFYKDAKVIVLDEATSALDIKTEARVMESFRDMGDEITILMIAHRIATLQDCDRIVKMDNGKLSLHQYLP